MKTRRQKNEKGQALILILLAVAGLVGLTALAVDGGHVFATQRQARNAADTAAFAAAVANIEIPEPRDAGAVQAALRTAGLARAASNNFEDTLDDPDENSGAPIDVIVNWPPKADSTGTPTAYIDNTDYVQVIIAAQVPTFFAPVIGVSTIPIRVQAVARAEPPYEVELGGENGIVALGEGCDIIKIHGTDATVTVTGGGIYSNSHEAGEGGGNCYALRVLGQNFSVEATNVDLVGCLSLDSLEKLEPAGIPVTCGVPAIDYPLPAPAIDAACTTDGYRVGNTFYPGNWYGTFPPTGGGGGAQKVLKPGLYCLWGVFRINNNTDITVEGDPAAGDPGVTFVTHEDVTWNGAATINFWPTTEDQNPELKGLLIYEPYTPGCTPSGTNTCHDIYLGGSGTSVWGGTIFAPDSTCQIVGTAESGTPLNIRAKIICYQVDIGGTGDLNIFYDGDDSWPFPFPPITELNR